MAIYNIQVCKVCKNDCGTFCKKGHKIVRNMANNCKDFEGERYKFDRDKANPVYTRTWQGGK